MRIGTAAILVIFAGFFALPATATRAQPPERGSDLAAPREASDFSAQRRYRRPPTRLRVYPSYRPEPDGVYPRYFPGRNAVRECSATYVQEYRPSGTVIVPRVSCFWRPG